MTRRSTAPPLARLTHPCLPAAAAAVQVRFMTACFQGAAMVSVIDFTFQAGLHSMTDWQGSTLESAPASWLASCVAKGCS